MAGALVHLFIYFDEYEGGQIRDFVGAYDTLEEAEKQLLGDQQDNRSWAYTASFDLETRRWTILRHYNRTSCRLDDNHRIAYSLDDRLSESRWIYYTDDYNHWRELRAA